MPMLPAISNQETVGNIGLFLAHRGEKDGKVSFWLQPRDYGTDELREKWERIGSGISVTVVAAEEHS